MAAEESKGSSGCGRVDPSSYANLDAVLTTHIDLAWTVSFEAKTLTGSTTLKCTAVADGVDQLVLDSRALTVTSVTVDGEETTCEEGESSDALGTALIIKLPKTKANGDEFVVVIAYSTAPTASALQWLSKEQTADKKFPYLFSQCQAIHARSMMPCQDSPAAKLTYTAQVTVPEGVTALMSAIGDGKEAGEDGVTFKFKQPVKIPTYLLALAVGLLESRDIGPRSKVWAEPSVVEKAAYEFAETEAFLSAGEKLLGPYVWTQYDVLCMPPSFPFGGMENPQLTFVTPTLLAGDRSLADVICHEIAHSWTGNLVTANTWRDFWLNEGCTMWVQRKIMESLHGGPDGGFFDFDAKIGLSSLQDDLELLGHDNPLTAMVPNLEGIDPDDAFSSVPYEKGFSFLYYLQTVVGGAAAFDPWFKSYIQAFANKTVKTEEFKAFFLATFGEKEGVDAIDWDKWFNAPGLIEWKSDWDTSMSDSATGLAARWVAGGEDCTDKAEWEKLSTGQKLMFLDTLKATQAANKEDDKLTHDVAALERLDTLYGLTASGNAEIRFRWQTVGLRGGYETVLPAALAFVAEQGRMKFVRPLYRDMFKTTFGKEAALKCFEENRSGYHPVAAKMIATDLGMRSTEASS